MSTSREQEDEELPHSIHKLQASDMDAALEAVLKAKCITVITGAGISVAAGIPPFRKDGGIYVEKGKHSQTQELMRLSALNDVNLRRKHCQFIAKMAQKSTASNATEFHQFLAILRERKLLRRLYSQNIDFLEEKVGFTPESYIALHGSLKNLRCVSCAYEDLLETHFETLSSGMLPQCPNCRDTPRERTNGALRPRSIGYMRPAILLYDEQSSGEFVQIINADIARTGSSEVLLVVGTSLNIPAVQDIVKHFATTMLEQGGNTVYIDLAKPSKRWDPYFSIALQGDCQDFARRAISRLSEPMQPNRRAIDEYEHKVYTRRDKRPFWSWA